jgi:dipeptidyl aminopeptidase/acylaminoacyl peptidase
MTTITWRIPGLVAMLSAMTGARVSPPPFLSEPEMVGAGIISTADDEYAGSLTPDGKTIYYNKSVPAHNQYTVVVSHLVAGNWSKPVIAPWSGRYSDTDPEVSPDGKTIYFASDRPLGDVIKHDYDIWKVELQADGRWSAPMHLPAPINSDANEYMASVTSDGTIYVSSFRDGLAAGTVDIYRIPLEDGEYKTATNVSHDFNARGPSFADLDAIVSSDDRVMIFSSFGRPDTYGSADLYVSYRQDGKWQPAHHLKAPFNSPERDYSPRFSPDGAYIYFSSERRGASDHPAAPPSYADLEKQLRGILNGGGNIYRISRTMLDSAADSAAVYVPK